MNSIILEELHRLRDFHAGQLNAFNISGSVAVVAAAATIFISDSFPEFKSTLFASVFIGLVLLASIGLFFAASLHWNHHAGQIRRIDGLLQAEYATQTATVAPAPAPPGTVGAVLRAGATPLANGMGANWSPAYWVTGIAVGMLGLAAIAVLAMRVWPSPQP